MRKAVIYARVSSVEQQKEGFSIAAQVKLMRDYAQRHGFKVVEEFEESETAGKSGRTLFKKMVQLVNSRKDIDVILVEKTDRLTRNFDDLVLINQLINTMDLEIHLVKESDILSKESKSGAKFIFAIKVAQAEFFLNNLREETSKGMVEKASQGHWPTRAPYGYRNNRNTRLIEVNPEQAVYVRRAYELYATGLYSLKRLREQLYEEGLRYNPSLAKAPTSKLHVILINDFYTGRLKFKDISRIGHHPPIVSIELYNRVQRQMRRFNKPDFQSRRIAYQGLINCGYCGCAVVGQEKKNGRYVYYRCTHAKRKCPDGFIREEVLQQQLAEAVRAFSLTDDQYQWMIQGLKEINAEKDVQVKETIDYLVQEIQRLNNRQSKLFDEKLDGNIDNDLFQRKRQEIDERIRDCEEQLSRLNKASKMQMDLGLAILEFSKDAYGLFSRLAPFEQARMMTVVLSNCELKGGKLTPTYKKPFNILAEEPQKEKNYPRQDSNLRPSA